MLKKLIIKKYGINYYLNNLFSKKYGINNNKNLKFLKTKFKFMFNNYVSSTALENKSSNIVKENINFFKRIKSYKGNRH